MIHTCVVLSRNADLLRDVQRELAGFGELGNGICLNGRAYYEHCINEPTAQRHLTASLGALAGHYGYVLFHRDKEYTLLKAAPETFMTRSRLSA